MTIRAVIAAVDQPGVKEDLPESVEFAVDIADGDRPGAACISHHPG
jgi:hypothetical protein